MQAFFRHALITTALLLPAGIASAEEQVSEPRHIDAGAVKIKLGGVIGLRMKQGATPSLTLIGDKDSLAKVTVTQNGDTLTIDTTGRNWSFGGGRRELRAELTLPALTSFESHGVGSTDVQGFSGDQIKLSLDGAGSLDFNSHYRNVVAHLGGVGSMTLNSGTAERIELDMHGAGHIDVNGQAKLLKANLGGVGSLEAKALRADAVDLDMSGLGSATVYATTSANLKLNGLGSATVYGKPANRNASAHGLGSVSWD